jgi:protoheme IX farnesyltransferase
MSGALYFAGALVLGGIYVAYALRIQFAYSDRLARQAFRYSIVYLAALFAALLIDHYLPL